MPLVFLSKVGEAFSAVFGNGEHIVGRGPALECQSKKVSRKHGIIKVTENDGVFLYSTHTNPCFYQSSATKCISIITNGKSTQIYNKDRIALSLDHGWFIVKIDDPSHSNINTALQTNLSFVNDANINLSFQNTAEETQIESFSANINDTLCSNKREHSSDENEISNKKTKLDGSNNSNSEDNPTFIIPNPILASINENNPNIQTNEPSSNSTERNESIPEIMPEPLDETLMDALQNIVSENKESTKRNVEILKIKLEPLNETFNNALQNLVAENSQNVFKAEIPKIKIEPVDETIPATNNNKNEANNNDKVNDKDKPDNENKIKVKDEVDDEDNIDKDEAVCEDKDKTKDKDKVVKDEAKDDKNGKDGKMDDKDVEHRKTQTNKENINDDKPSTSGTGKKVWRDKCWYGSKCYRKNAAHRAELRHPGDSDYDSDPNDSRPICCYGADCYRKNKEHRQKFRHPGQEKPKKRPSRPRRKTKAKKDPTTKTDFEDSYDYSNPFLNDGSSDEYAASDSSYSDSDYTYDEDVEEDTAGMLHEARNFTKKKDS